MSPRRPGRIFQNRPVRAKALVTLLGREQNPLRRKMLLLGYISDRLKKEKQTLYLVGGQAVETYTGGQFTTGDIDITTTDRPATEKLLNSLGLKEIGMIWLSEKLSVAVHIVGPDLSGDPEKTVTFETGPYNVNVIGIEDLIVDRLSHAKFWNSPGDLEKAKALYATFKNRLDTKYLAKTAGKRKVSDFLEQVTRTEKLCSIRGSRTISREDWDRVSKKMRDQKRSLLRKSPRTQHC